MNSGKLILFFCYILTTFFCCLTNAHPNHPIIESYCNFGDIGNNYSSNSVFQANLDKLISTLSASEARFYNFPIGQNPDKVNVIALCRGDVPIPVCRECLIRANTELRQKCPNEKQVIGWYDECMLRYSDEPISNTMQTLPDAYTYNPKLVSNPTQFNLAVNTMLNTLLKKASRGTVRKFAVGNTKIGPENNMMTIYALAECTPDLSVSQCKECLSGTSTQLLKCCSGKIGGRVVRPSCNFRYEIDLFYKVRTTGP